MLARAIDVIVEMVDNAVDWLEELVGSIFRGVLALCLVALCIAAFFWGRELFRDIITVTNELHFAEEAELFVSRLTTFGLALFAFMVVASIFIIHLSGRLDNFKKLLDEKWKLEKRIQMLEDFARQREHELRSQTNEANSPSPANDVSDR